MGHIEGTCCFVYSPWAKGSERAAVAAAVVCLSRCLWALSNHMAAHLLWAPPQSRKRMTPAGAPAAMTYTWIPFKHIETTRDERGWRAQRRATAVAARRGEGKHGRRTGIRGFSIRFSDSSMPHLGCFLPSHDTLRFGGWFSSINPLKRVAAFDRISGRTCKILAQRFQR